MCLFKYYCIPILRTAINRLRRKRLSLRLVSIDVKFQKFKQKVNACTCTDKVTRWCVVLSYLFSKVVSVDNMETNIFKLMYYFADRCNDSYVEWRNFQNSATVGSNDIILNDVWTQGQCERSCLAKSTCNAIKHNPSRGQCILTSSTRDDVNVTFERTPQWNYAQFTCVTSE